MMISAVNDLEEELEKDADLEKVIKKGAVGFEQYTDH